MAGDIGMKEGSKSAWRTRLIVRRRQISSVDRIAAAKSARDILSHSPIFQKSQHIACYYPLNDEFDCLPIIQAIWESDKNCYLPVLANNLLCFKRYQENTQLALNRYNIPEPAQEESIALEKLDLVIVPLVGFDQQGHRLGMGAGYYDRTFHNLDGSLLGLAYESQQALELPSDSWDVPLRAVLTEKRFISFA